jgi:hypothetical protein
LAASALLASSVVGLLLGFKDKTAGSILLLTSAVENEGFKL